MKRLNSKNTLKIEVSGFADGFEVRKTGIQDGSKVFGWTAAFIDLPFTEMEKTAVRRK